MQRHSKLLLSFLCEVIFLLAVTYRLAAQDEIFVTKWGDVSASIVNLNQVWIENTKGERRLLYTDKKKNCAVSAVFLNSDHLLILSCDGHFVVNLQATVQYKIPRYEYAYYTANRFGTRFAVYERGRSFWHAIGDESYDKMRVVVYSTEEGKRLFE